MRAITDNGRADGLVVPIGRTPGHPVLPRTPTPVRAWRTTDPYTGTRRCYACRETKRLTAFYRCRRDSLGREHRCKDCKKAEVARWHAERRVLAANAAD